MSRRLRPGSPCHGKKAAAGLSHPPAPPHRHPPRQALLRWLRQTPPPLLAASAKRSRSGWRKERNGASPRLPPNKPAADAKAFLLSITLKCPPCWESPLKPAQHPLRRLQLPLPHQRPPRLL